MGVWGLRVLGFWDLGFKIYRVPSLSVHGLFGASGFRLGSSTG